MAQARTSTCLVFLVVLLALAAFCYAGPEGIARAAQAHGGIVGDLVGQLKREDDEAEVQEIREHEPATREEREEAHEQAEEVAIQVAQQREAEES
jgi:hypothetical protein